MPFHSMPDATEEEWERRFKKRRAAVDAIKAKPDYQNMAAQRAAAHSASDDSVASTTAGGEEFPATPEVDDTNRSKRSWEAAVMQWRDSLKPWAPAVPMEA